MSTMPLYGPVVEPAISMHSRPVSAAGFDEIQRSTLAPGEQPRLR